MSDGQGQNDPDKVGIFCRPVIPTCRRLVEAAKFLDMDDGQGQKVLMTKAEFAMN